MHPKKWKIMWNFGNQVLIGKNQIWGWGKKDTYICVLQRKKVYGGEWTKSFNNMIMSG